MKTTTTTATLRIMSTALLVTATCLTASTTASADTPDHVEVTVPLEADCSTLTEEGRAYFLEHDIHLCGVGASSARGVVSGNCGSSAIYVDRLGSGRGRVSWALYAGEGVTMVGRNINITWGPAAGGTFADVSPMASLAYSKSREVTGKGRLSASIQGSVALVGKYLTCKIPRHQSSYVTL